MSKGPPRFVRTFYSNYGHGDPYVKLLFLYVAERVDDPNLTKEPGGWVWVRVGMRSLAERLGCDIGTVPDIVDRAQDEGLKTDWSGPKSRVGYMLPADLYPEGEQAKGRARPRRPKKEGKQSVWGGATDDEDSPDRPSVGTAPTDLLGQGQHDSLPNPLTPSTSGEDVQRRESDDDTKVVAFRRPVSQRTGSLPQRDDCDTTLDQYNTTPSCPVAQHHDAYAPAREARPVASRASPSAPSHSSNQPTKQARGR